MIHSSKFDQFFSVTHFPIVTDFLQCGSFFQIELGFSQCNAFFIILDHLKKGLHLEKWAIFRETGHTVKMGHW